jgi:GH15 family glucan-1,4-alpha-glucosidase
VCDATALLLAFHGFDDAGSWRMQRTCQRIDERLRAGPGLLYRYEQSFESGEGAFAMCGFWFAEFLAKGGGTLDQAREAVAHTLSYASDVGLFAEEIDPRTGDGLGNFPQAFTHVGLVNAALSLAGRERQGREHGDGSQRGLTIDDKRERTAEIGL